MVLVFDSVAQSKGRYQLMDTKVYSYWRPLKKRIELELDSIDIVWWRCNNPERFLLPKVQMMVHYSHRQLVLRRQDQEEANRVHLGQEVGLRNRWHCLLLFQDYQENGHQCYHLCYLCTMVVCQDCSFIKWVGFSWMKMSAEVNSQTNTPKYKRMMIAIGLMVLRFQHVSIVKSSFLQTYFR